MISTVLNRQVRGSEKIVNYSMMRSISLPLGLSRPRLVSLTPPWSILTIFFPSLLVLMTKKIVFQIEETERNGFYLLRSWNETLHCVPRSFCELKNSLVDWAEKGRDGLRSAVVRKTECILWFGCG